MEKTIGLIPVSETIFTGYNAFITIGLIVMLPFLARMMMPKPGDVVSVDPALLAEPPSVERQLSLTRRSPNGWRKAACCRSSSRRCARRSSC